MEPKDRTIVPRVSGQVGRYKVLSELGRGAMGRVYLAEDPNIERRVAVKVLYPEVVDVRAQQEFQKRFVIEARAAGRLNHPGIVTVYDAGTDPETGHSFIAMELIEGEPLEKILERQGRLPAATAIAVASQVARALAYAHGQGVIHRDVKPANILVGAGGQVKVTDFGVAKLGLESQTMAGQLLGTPAFMSPEQIRTAAVDGRSDLFSLGTVLYQSLTGQNPFQGDSIATITYKIVNADPPSVQAYVPGLPDALAAVVDRALRKDPEERFESGDELAEALEIRGPLHVSGQLEGAGPRVLSEAGPGSGPGAAEDLPLAGATVVAAARPPTPGILRRWAWPVVAVLLAGLGLAALLVLRFPEPVPEDRTAVITGEPAAAQEEREEPAEDIGNLSPDPPPAGAGEESEATTAAAPSGEPEAGAGGETAAATVPTATLELLYENHLHHSWISVWVDGRQTWVKELTGPKSRIRRAVGQQIDVPISVAAGTRSIEVRITEEPLEIDAVEHIRASFAAGQIRHLRVALKRKANELELLWVE